MSPTTTDRPHLPRAAQIALARGAGAVLWAGTGLAVLILTIAVLLRWYEHLPNLEDLRWRILLTLLGITAGAWISRPILLAARKLPKLVPFAGAIALNVSQVCFYLLVWTRLKTSPALWRIWWVTLVISLAAAHVSWVRLLVAQPDTRRWVRSVAWIVWICIPIAAALMIGLGLGRTPLPDWPDAYKYATAIPLAIAALGTILLAIRAWRLRLREATGFQKIVWTSVAVTCAVAIGFYIGRISAPPPPSLDAIPAALAHISGGELDAQLDQDLYRLKIVSTGLDELSEKAAAAHQQLQATLKAEKRDYYRPAEEDQIRAMFMSYLAYRAALLRLAATYANFPAIPDRSLRTRAFLIGYSAGATVMERSTRLVSTYRDEAPARRKLNEADETCGIPAGTFDRIYAAVTNDANLDKIDEMAAYFQTHRDDWRRDNLMDEADFNWLDARISRSLQGLRGGRIDSASARLEQLYQRVKQDVYNPLYASQSVVSTLIGDTRMVSRPPFINISQVRQMEAQLRPGDICLERRNWFMSNAFLPGFWPHAALYVGTIEDLEKLGLVKRDGNRWTSDDPAIRDRLEEFLSLAEDRQPHTVIESVSEGVIFNSLTESMHADYVAVLRPHKLSDADRAKAIARAFSHVGKPYDFEFDFFSADKLVCTELVYRSYDGLIKFELVPIMGRNTLPALDIARKFCTERASDNRDLDLVLFLDAVPQERAARFATVEDFCNSVHRPRGFNE